ncbi:response regulator [Desulfonema magnum]|uniref:Two component system response regulator n=1 Tax=Desulfonema magnum TaxID=45655 RepID=A0A975BVT7_9BACT|nr:response regulator [Desulfonema magnum]QTA92302.1 Two component system response regulator [Desulfonema magnum]
MKILLVDDETELVSTLAERLEIRGIEAEWVSNGEDALKKTETQSYDLAVLDVKMPKIGGFKLKKILHEKYPDMKFIFLTGHGSEDDFKAGTVEAGVAYYLVKPVKIEALIEKIHAALGEHE